LRQRCRLRLPVCIIPKGMTGNILQALRKFPVAFVEYLGEGGVFENQISAFGAFLGQQGIHHFFAGLDHKEILADDAVSQIIELTQTDNSVGAGHDSQEGHHEIAQEHLSADRQFHDLRLLRSEWEVDYHISGVCAKKKTRRRKTAHEIMRCLQPL